MADTTITRHVSRLNSLSDVCATCSLAAGEALAEIPYGKYRRQVDALSGVVAILDQLAAELKALSEQADNLAVADEI